MQSDFYEFDEFRVVPGERTVYEGGEPVRLSSRAFDLLVALLGRAGSVVGKAELVALVWPSRVVEEVNLRVHISSLRKVLRDGQDGRRYIESVAGQGYCFISSVTPAAVSHEHAAALAIETWLKGEENLPPLASSIIGREGAIATLVDALAQRRLLSIVGPGGVGKTTIAIPIARQLADRLQLPVRFLDLAAIIEPGLIASALATVIGLQILTDEVLPVVLTALKGKRLLLVLDSCEHLINEATVLAERLFLLSPELFILATSREPLRAQGESLYRLQPLETPTDGRNVTALEACKFSAIRLFYERARSGLDTFVLRDKDVPAVVELCQKLDGLPLAIEFAAARIELFGIKGLLLELGDRFRLLTAGRRTALPRHQTLRATLDWSYELLAPDEQAVLRRLSIFGGSFMLGAATAVAACAALLTPHVFNAVSKLAAKSLLTVETDDDVTSYRLLDNTRAYAYEKLSQSDEGRAVASKHAVYCQGLLIRAACELTTESIMKWVQRYGRVMNDLRTAMDWAFGEQGDAQIGVRLTADSAPLWYHMSLIAEYRGRLKIALAAIESQHLMLGEVELRLNIAFAYAEFYTSGPVSEVGYAAFRKGQRMARKMGNIQHELNALYGLCVAALARGQYQEGYRLAVDIRTVAPVSDDALILYERLMAFACFHLGELRAARGHAQRALAMPLNLPHVVVQNALRQNHHVAVLTVQAKILWVKGYPEQALAVADEAVAHALFVGNKFSLIYALAVGACPVTAWAGDGRKLEQFFSMLSRHAQEQALPHWQTWIRCFQIAMTSHESEESAEALIKSGGCEFASPLHELLVTLNAQMITPEALRRVRSGEAGWSSAEILRAQGERLLRRGAPDAIEKAEALFMQSLSIARRQGALSWELRTAMSLARLRLRANQRDAAQALLYGVYGRFSEGFSTRDLLEAASLLEQLAAEQSS